MEFIDRVVNGGNDKPKASGDNSRKADKLDDFNFNLP